MKAIALTGFGIPESFEECQISIPELTDTQVLVEVYASSINPGDNHLRSGDLMQSAVGDQFKIHFPHFLGGDVAGIVRGVGKEVHHLKLGDRVMGMVRGGSYMDYVAVEENTLTTIPENVSFEEASAAPTIALTAWQALFKHGNLQAGQRIFINGGAGGVGHVAIQLAKQHGAYVITTAREHNREFVMGLGADEFIDFTKIDFTKSISEPVDIVLDTAMLEKKQLETGLPGEFGDNSYAILKDAGKYISIISFGIGISPRVRNIEPIFFQANPNRFDLNDISIKMQEEKLKIHVDQIYPFTANGLFDAYRKSEQQPKRGKIVILKGE
ncbi:Zn-dependent oxidoreductase [Paenibacillus borealis]|uniref:Zn-dependent oxidoreductase n=1 Tax=Paenibacillus borealis TaxID=160799 RepID=A0ABX3H9A1_PAEBO|nr:NADP-dependent oxidoreductase [Paenibacillus borealis]OMD46231.1 Zn-dependent oxidoreductase [Paenibacillus borealis]